jgi:hypothetical protein
MYLEANGVQTMKKQILTVGLGAIVMLGTASTLLAQGPPTGGYPPVAGGAAGNPATNPGFMPYTSPSGKTVQLRKMKVHGHMMVLVPIEMACDVFHVSC